MLYAAKGLAVSMMKAYGRHKQTTSANGVEYIHNPGQRRTSKREKDSNTNTIHTRRANRLGRSKGSAMESVQ